MTDEADIFSKFIFDFLLKAGIIAQEEQKKISAQRKADRSLVTNADLKISRFFTESFQPFKNDQHLLVDEEIIDKDKITADKLFSAPHTYTWLIDPIAGTTCYSAGTPLYAISVGVLKDREPFVGGVYFPGLHELYLSDSRHSWLYVTPSSYDEQRTLLLSPTFNSDFIPPLFHHCSHTVLKRYNLIQKELPFVMFPTINIGILWAALGRFSAAVIQAKLWDIAGSWAILHTTGLTIRNIETGEALEKVSERQIDDQWRLRDAFVITTNDYFPKIRQKLMKTNGNIQPSC